MDRSIYKTGFIDPYQMHSYRLKELFPLPEEDSFLPCCATADVFLDIVDDCGRTFLTSTGPCSAPTFISP